MSGRYARYYLLDLPLEVKVEINLISDVDSYLNLLNGSGRNGSIRASNNNSGLGTDARITATLPAGTYTIEALPNSRNSTSDFHLRVRLPQVTPLATNAAYASYDYIRLLVLPSIRATHTVGEDWITERFGSTTYKTFVKHKNSLILHNKTAVYLAKGGPPSWRSATTNVYTDSDDNSRTRDTHQFSISSNQWNSAGIYPGDTDWWGGTAVFEDGKASTQYLYDSSVKTYATTHFSFGWCRDGGCPDRHSGQKVLNLWGGN